MKTTMNKNELRRLSKKIAETRKTFNYIVKTMCNDIAKELNTNIITFDEVEVDCVDGFVNGINGYSATYKQFFCDDINYPIDMDTLTAESIAKAMNTITNTAKSYYEEA